MYDTARRCRKSLTVMSTDWNGQCLGSGEDDLVGARSTPGGNLKSVRVAGSRVWVLLLGRLFNLGHLGV